MIADENQNSPQAQLVCRLALKSGLIQPDQADRALALQRKLAALGRPLGLVRILMAEKMIGPEQGEKLRVAVKREQDKAFCRLAEERGFLDKKAAAAALQRQSQVYKERGCYLAVARILEKTGALTASQCADLLEHQGRPLPPDAAAAAEVCPAETTPPVAQEDVDPAVVEAPPDSVFGKVPEASVKAESEDNSDDQTVQIVYHFATDHDLTVGRVTEEGKIDFKEKGSVPWVSAGDVLAEKILPPAPADDAGPDNPEAPVGDIPWRCGRGVRVSEDGLKVVATAEGQPKLAFDGKIWVSGCYAVDNVDIKTGHVNFEGDVRVKQAIRDGFQVSGAAISAGQVNKATLDAAGAVTVSGGIIGAHITARGRVTAKYVENATIHAYGAVVVQKEIINSQIITGDSCLVPAGKIISSDIAAGNQIQARQVGTEVAAPCRLKVGGKDHLEKEIGAIDARISENKRVIAQTEKKLQALQADEKKRHEAIAELAQVEDRSGLAAREKTRAQEEAVAAGDFVRADRLAEEIAGLTEKARSAADALEKLLNEQEEVEGQCLNLKNALSTARELLRALAEERRTILKWAEKIRAKARLTVTGPVHEGTVLAGKRAILTLSRTRSHIRVKEVRQTAEDGTVSREMVITSL